MNATANTGALKGFALSLLVTFLAAGLGSIASLQAGTFYQQLVLPDWEASEEHLRSISAASRQYGVIINDAEGMTFMPGYEEAYQAPRTRRTLWSRFT